MQTFLQLVVSGLTQGVLVGAFALALATFYQVSKVINVAIGDIGVFGALAFISMRGSAVPTLLALAIVLVGAIAFAYIYDSGILSAALRRPSSDPELQLFLLTFALSMVVQGVALKAFGRDVHSLPPFSSGSPIRAVDVVIDRQAIVLAAVAVLVCVAMVSFSRFSLYGKALTACGLNERGALAVGISPAALRRIALALSIVLAIVVAIIASPLTGFVYSSGFGLAMNGLGAAVLVGLRAPVPAFGVGLILGVLQSVVGAYVSGPYQGAVALALITLYLVARPNVVNAR